MPSKTSSSLSFPPTAYLTCRFCLRAQVLTREESNSVLRFTLKKCLHSTHSLWHSHQYGPPNGTKALSPLLVHITSIRIFYRLPSTSRGRSKHTRNRVPYAHPPFFCFIISSTVFRCSIGSVALPLHRVSLSLALPYIFFWLWNKDWPGDERVGRNDDAQHLHRPTQLLPEGSLIVIARHLGANYPVPVPHIHRNISPRVHSIPLSPALYSVLSVFSLISPSTLLINISSQLIC